MDLLIGFKDISSNSIFLNNLLYLHSFKPSYTF